VLKNYIEIIKAVLCKNACSKKDEKKKRYGCSSHAITLLKINPNPVLLIKSHVDNFKNFRLYNISLFFIL